MRNILRHTFLALLLMVAAVAAAQEVVSVGDAIALYTGKNIDKAKTTLQAKGYTYKGITGYESKSHTWCKRVDLTKDYVPTAFQSGTSSIVGFATDHSTLTVYVFNRTAFDAMKAEAKKLGYETDKKADFFYKDDAPYLMFLELGKPFPYMMQISQ